MKVVRAKDVAAISRPDDSPPYEVDWLEGPHTSDQLDVGVAHAAAGSVTPPHVHHGGQVMIVVAGRGFVECDGDRIDMEVGDVVICEPGERHVHGATSGGPVSHLTITTGVHDVG